MARVSVKTDKDSSLVRLGAANPWVRSLYKHFEVKGIRTESLRSVGLKSWLPGRFPRIPAEDGVNLVGSADLFEINPDLTKRIADIDFGDEFNGRVKRGWLLLARSGQTYGLNGTMVMSNEFHEEKVISDAIRIAPGVAPLGLDMFIRRSPTPSLVAQL